MKRVRRRSGRRSSTACVRRCSSAFACASPASAAAAAASASRTRRSAAMTRGSLFRARAAASSASFCRRSISARCRWMRVRPGVNHVIAPIAHPSASLSIGAGGSQQPFQHGRRIAGDPDDGGRDDQEPGEPTEAPPPARLCRGAAQTSRTRPGKDATARCFCVSCARVATSACTPSHSLFELRPRLLEPCGRHKGAKVVQQATRRFAGVGALLARVLYRSIRCRHRGACACHFFLSERDGAAGVAQLYARCLEHVLLRLEVAEHAIEDLGDEARPGFASR